MLLGARMQPRYILFYEGMLLQAVLSRNEVSPSGTLDERDYCIECGSAHLVQDYSRGELFCSSCGLIAEDRIVERAPAAFPEDGDRYSRARQWGPSRNELLPNFGISTAPIGDRDPSGQLLPATKADSMRRLRKWDRRAKYQACRKRNLDLALSEISAICSQLGLNKNVKLEAATICRRLKEFRLHGRPTEDLVASTVYAACRLLSVPRTLDEISEVSGVEKKDIGRSYRFLVRKLGLDVPTPSPEEYVPRFTSELDLPLTVTQAAIKLARISGGSEICIGRGPIGIAAGAVYIASQESEEPRTQMQVSEVTGVADATIRAASRAIKKICAEGAHGRGPGQMIA